MTSLFEILKTSKTGMAPDLFTALLAEKFGYTPTPASQQTKTGAPPIYFISDGTPLIAYSIIGNMEQTGTPSSANPIFLSETGERTANLFDFRTWSNSIASINGNGTFTTNEHSISITSGTSTDAYTSPFGAGNPATYRLKVKPNTTYSVRIDGSGSYQLILWKNGTTGSGYGQYFNSGRKFATITTDSETTFYTFRAANTGSLGSTATLSNVMVVEGEYTAQTMPSYEPYGYKLPIISGGVTTPYYLSAPIRKIGTYVDTASDTVTRVIKKLVFDGTEASWKAGGGFFYNDSISPDYLRTSDRIVYCTHYQGINSVTSGGSVGTGECSFYSVAGVQRLYIKDTNYTTLEAFKTFLADQYTAGTPVTVWYVLATAETESVTAPSIPTIDGEQTFDVDTTLKPSEVTIEYMGW